MNERRLSKNRCERYEARDNARSERDLFAFSASPKIRKTKFVAE